MPTHDAARTTRTSRGMSAAATLKAASGRPTRVARLMNEMCWRAEARLVVDGDDRGPAADLVEIDLEDHETTRLITTTVVALRVDGIDVPVDPRSRRLQPTADGGWTIDGRTLRVVQPEGAGAPRWH